MKKILISAVIVLALVVGGVSVYAVQKEKTGRLNKAIGLNAEQQQILTEKIKVDLDEMLAAEEITQEQYDKLAESFEKGHIPFGGAGFGRGRMGEMKKGPGFNAEKKEEMLNLHKEKLKEKLEKGEITEEEYNELIKKSEEGNFGFGMPGKRHEMTEEEKAEFEAKMKEKMPEFKRGNMKMPQGERPFKGNMGGKRPEKTEE